MEPISARPAHDTAVVVLLSDTASLVSFHKRYRLWIVILEYLRSCLLSCCRLRSASAMVDSCSSFTRCMLTKLRQLWHFRPLSHYWYLPACFLYLLVFFTWMIIPGLLVLSFLRLNAPTLIASAFVCYRLISFLKLSILGLQLHQGHRGRCHSASLRRVHGHITNLGPPHFLRLACFFPHPSHFICFAVFCAAKAFPMYTGSR
jgi:hypothetical protein